MNSGLPAVHAPGARINDRVGRLGFEHLLHDLTYGLAQPVRVMARKVLDPERPGSLGHVLSRRHLPIGALS